MCSTYVTFRVNIKQHTFNVTTQNTSHHNLLIQIVYIHWYQLRHVNLLFRTQHFFIAWIGLSQIFSIHVHWSVFHHCRRTPLFENIHSVITTVQTPWQRRVHTTSQRKLLKGPVRYQLHVHKPYALNCRIFRNHFKYRLQEGIWSEL